MHPEVSLIATTLNEAASIADFLHRISRQIVLPFEITVVDGGSTDGTLKILQEWQPPAGVRTVIISRPGANISTGRNAAIAAASGKWVAVTDAGAYADDDWLKNLTMHTDDDVDVVAGFFAPAPSTFLATTIASTITPTLGEIDARTFLPSSRSVAMRRECVLAVGGYPEWLDYCEDLVLDMALKAAGARIVFEPRARVTWQGRSTWRAFFKQYYRYARGDGKAGLWPKRHAVRYLAYGIGVIGTISALTLQAPVILVLLAVGVALYFSKFARRVLAHSRRFGRPLTRLLLVPAVVVVGDVAKMLGFPVGVRWARSNASKASHSTHHELSDR